MPKKVDHKELVSEVDRLRKKIARLQEANKELRSEKRMLDEILDSLPGTFYIWDEQPKLLRWNRRHEEITEYSGEDYPGMLPTDFFDPSEHPSIQAGIEKTFTQGEVTVEATLVTKSGKRVPHIYTALRTTLEDKPVLMGFGIDITKRVEAEQQLRHALQEIKELKAKLEADYEYLGEEITQIHDYRYIIGESAVMKYVLYNVKQIAPTDTTVLILGESGTGKELIARAIHHGSKRKARPLIKVDCAALPANLIESELFGHEKGAFTGAIDKRIGRFELANGATIFLDEIGELPLELQKKLLRVLQDGEYERVGSARLMHTDVRIIAATNRDLNADVSARRFRKDLWYRLNVLPLSLPPLRDRTGDIPLLAEFILAKVRRRLGKEITVIPTSVMRELENYPWPGNVRELENVIERAAIFSKGKRLALAAQLRAFSDVNKESPETTIKSLYEVEKDHILRALEKARWNVTGKGGAADLLGLPPGTLRGRMRKHGIHRPSSDR